MAPTDMLGAVTGAAIMGGFLLTPRLARHMGRLLRAWRLRRQARRAGLSSTLEDIRALTSNERNGIIATLDKASRS